jgi:hypothetical protein
MDRDIPVAVESASIPAIPRRRAHHEVIDVDELDDEQQDQRPSQRPRHPVPLGDSSRDFISSEIIILDSDDGSEPGPSTGRRPGKSTLTTSVRWSVLIRPSQSDYAPLLRQSRSSTLHPQSHA